MAAKRFAAFAFSEKSSYLTPRWQHRIAQPVILANVCEFSKAVFPRTVLLLDSFWLRKITTDPHVLAHINRDSG